MLPTIIANAHDLNAAQEIWFIQNILFSGSPINLGYNHNAISNETVVYLELNEISGELIQSLRASGNKIVLYHMGDEFCRMNRAQYKNCDLVIRNYFFNEAISHEQCVDVIWAPCGFKTGVGPRSVENIKPVNRRKWLASFLGWLNNPCSYNDERKDFLEASLKCQENLFLQPTDGFAKGWNTSLYSVAMECSIFSPCPAGNSPETIRLYDALEMGCIPISLSHDFITSSEALGLIGPVPFPILDSWQDLPAFLNSAKNLLSEPSDEIRKLQLRCISWWSDYKSTIQNKISSRIQAL